MDRLIYSAMTGAKATLDQQGTVANNLANAATSGFRAQLHKLRAVEVETQALPTRAFVVDAEIATDFTPGPLQLTARPLDVALAGPGWLAVLTPDGGEAYTRDGGLDVSPEGVLQTRAGLPVWGEGGLIRIPPDTEISIGEDGTISAHRRDEPNLVDTLDRIRLVDPPRETLVRGEDGLFRRRDGALTPADPQLRLVSGYLEGSNVNAVDMMAQMISLGRQFEMQMRMLQSADENARSAGRLLTTS
ncbi:MAG: flagellar basal body rod protein FlgF [Sphingobacteriia bacterium]|nr:flagellar basal body rod protein FlgF [Sphingobacteriia bacterium]NCC38995.1 flagellar basal body rod protein FlgF [Gammaproteobacteria bacterium]